MSLAAQLSISVFVAYVQRAGFFRRLASRQVGYETAEGVWVDSFPLVSQTDPARSQYKTKYTANYLRGLTGTSLKLRSCSGGPV